MAKFSLGRGTPSSPNSRLPAPPAQTAKKKECSKARRSKPGRFRNLIGFSQGICETLATGDGDTLNRRAVLVRHQKRGQANRITEVRVHVAGNAHIGGS